MARYDVHETPDGAGYLLDIQSDLLDVLNTRVVVPLIPEQDAPVPARRLNPVFTVNGARVVMMTQFLSAVPTAILHKPVGRLETRLDEITAAIDMLMEGV